MPRQQAHIEVTTDWTQLTDGDATTITFQATTGPVEIRRGSSATPADSAKGFRYGTGQGERDLAVASLAPASSGQRVWGRSLTANTETVVVDHA